jgi:hypothetical protein
MCQKGSINQPGTIRPLEKAQDTDLVDICKVNLVNVYQVGRLSLFHACVTNLLGTGILCYY